MCKIYYRESHERKLYIWLGGRHSPAMDMSALRTFFSKFEHAKIKQNKIIIFYFLVQYNNEISNKLFERRKKKWIEV